MPSCRHIFCRTLLFLLLAAAFPVHFPTPALAHAQVQKRENILVLHSYSQDFIWTRSQQEGIDAVFGSLAAAYDVQIEYLDAVHYPELLQDPRLLDILRAKYPNRHFKVVLTSDNAAFNFARAHRAELFPGVPIVFMGVNGYTDRLLQGEKGITGVAEDTDLAGTLKVLQQLLPRTKRIVFPGMTDDITYHAIRATITKELTVLPPEIRTEFPEYPDVDAALDALRKLPPDAAIVIMTNMRTRNGQGISSQRVVELVSAAAPVPVFTNWDFTVGHGATGGSVISGVEQGRQAAEIALRVLRGERPESIPVRRGAGKALLFDYRQLVRFDIPSSRLPPGSVVLFAPERILRVSRETAWAVGISFVLLLGVTVSLVLSVRRRRRAEEQVRVINRELESTNSALGIEIEGHRQAERKLSRLNRELRAISNCNQVLIKAEDEQTLLNEVCRIVCDEAGYRMAWAGYPVHDEAKTLQPAAWAGAEDGYLVNAQLTWADTERGQGPGGTSIRTGKSCCIQDFATDPHAVPWRESALQRGYRSCIALPLKSVENSVFGVLVIYSTEPDAFTSDEIRLMEELAGDLAFGIRSLRTRNARKEAEDALHIQTVELEQEMAQRQRAQEELQQLNNELELRVRQRTSELSDKNNELQKAYDELKITQTRLLQQDKMASIGQLAAGVAHEINNPMGFISSNLSSLGRYTEKLAAYLEDGEQAIAAAAPELGETLAQQRKALKIDRILQDLPELINESRDGAERVRRIVQDLKNFSRVDAKQVHADLNEGLESTLAIVWNELKYKATVTKDYGTLPPVCCNPGQINQVFMNLLINAAQAIESLGEIRIRTWSEDNSVHVSISDTGCGIPEEVRRHIFDPFFTTKEVGKGTGLGLAIAYDIVVNKHGGKIDLQSEAGKGTTFTITLPITPREQEMPT